MLEFCLVGLPIIFITFSLIWMCFGMWEYQSMEAAVSYVTRSSSAHGSDCAGLGCATTVGNVATTLQQMIGVPDNQVNVTLTSSASTVTCNPLNTCYTNTNSWPSLAGNTPGTDITIKAQYTMNLLIGLWEPGRGFQQFSAVPLAAQARQVVVY